MNTPFFAEMSHSVFLRKGKYNMQSDENVKTVSSIGEKQVKECRECRELKVRILKGKYNKKDKKWAGEAGGFWNGHVCPECHRRICAERQRERRQKQVQ